MPRLSPKPLTGPDISRLIEIAWEDRTPFDAIQKSFVLSEPQVIQLMLYELKLSSSELWRKRVTGRATKHAVLRKKSVDRGYCPTHYKNK